MRQEWRSPADERILLVEPDPDQLQTMRAALTVGGREIVAEPSLETARRLVAGERFAGIVLGARAVGTPELDLLQLASGLEPAPTVVVCSTQNNANAVASCYRAGAAGFLVKPAQGPALCAVLEQALTERGARLEQDEDHQSLQLELEERMAALERERARLCDLSAATLQALVTALEAKDRFMAGHSIRVAELGASIAAQLGYSDEEVESVRLAGRLHDLGMISVGAEIISKDGSLSADEYAQIKQHPLVGFRLLAPFEHLREIAKYVRGHHERWDGTGYPDGLARDAIPPGARVLAAAETYDALVSARPFRERLSPERAAEIIGELAGTALDPEVCRGLMSVVKRRRTLDFLRPDDEMLIEEPHLSANPSSSPGGASRIKR
jgi:HD-GYP domain-containing protein (c-di-GMP phosphodiesterase class II)